MFELIKDFLLVSLGAGIGIVTMCLLQAGKLADEDMKHIDRERNEKE